MRTLSFSSLSRPYFLGAGFSLLGLLSAGCADLGGSPLSDDESRLGRSEAALEGSGGGFGGGFGGGGGTSVGGGTTGPGGGFPEPDPGPPALGSWSFDDCDVATTSLADSSGNDLTAIRSASVACVAGISGLAAKFDEKNDVIEVASQPVLSFDQHIAVAAWVSPTDVSGSNPIMQRRANGKTTFSLGIDNGQAVFKVTLTSGQIVTTSAPVSANAWTHLAGVYDGQFILLFRNGVQVGQIAAAGTLRDVTAPIEIGKVSANARFHGLIDELWLSNSPVTAGDIQRLSCIQRPTTFTVSPAQSGPVAPETTVSYGLTVKNNDAGACNNGFFFVSPELAPDFNVDINNNFAELPPGQSMTLPIAVTSSSEAEPGVHQVPFTIFEFNNGNDVETVSGALTYEVAAPTGCFVRTGRELLIRGVSVVDDPIRTTSNAPADPRSGVWTFGRLMRDMAPTPADAPAFTQQLFNTWLTSQTINGFVVPSRSALKNFVLDPWPRSADGSLDLSKAPLQLLAIVNRIDLRDLSAGRAGEGRFVFGVLDQDGFPTQFTVILEYNLPAATEQDVLDWANQWHALGSLPFPSEQYNVALQALTTRFAGRNAAPGKPNGSALSQLRTNEIALSDPWELRELKISAATGFLTPVPVQLTPAISLDKTARLADFINANEASILVEQHTVPATFAGSPFLGGSSINELTAWTAPGINSNEARHKFSLNTCNGCHGSEETGTAFLHVFPRFPGQQASLSGFMTGITVPDPVTGQARTLNDLGRRNADLKGLVCTTGVAAIGAKIVAPVSVSKGISRVH